MITVMKGDVTRLDFDVIVTAANTSLTPVGVVGKEIFEKGGYRLQDACQRLGGCHTGEAKMTLSYDLPCRAIIHTVGPIYSGTKKDAEYLEACYWNSMSLAYEFFKLNKLKRMTLAFTCISTGAYAYPKDEACHIAVSTIQKIYQQYTKSRNIDVIFVCREEDDYLLYKEALKK
jgi:O-acetyl-ADP-ribose deacetylase